MRIDSCSERGEWVEQSQYIFDEAVISALGERESDRNSVYGLRMSIHLQTSASIQPRTSLRKFLKIRGSQMAVPGGI